MVVIKQIKSYDLPALFPSKVGVIAVSVDNQVVTLHRKGALILAVDWVPCQFGPDFTSKRSILDVPKTVDAVSIRSVENALVDGNKDQIMELMRDKVLTPRNYDGLEFLIYFSKAEWSSVRLKNGPLRIPRCVLATLTSTFQLMIYGQLNEVTDEYQRNWCPLLNVSQTANMILRQKWETEDEGRQSGGLGFEEYKKRMYELTCVDFTWMGPFVDEALDGADSELFMIVAHLNGSVDIWRIFTCAETQKLVGEVICNKIVVEGQGHVISTMKFQAVDSKIGILAIGTNSGRVRVVRIEKSASDARDSTEMDTGENGTKKMFEIQDGIDIWEADDLRIETFLFTIIPPEDRNISKRLSVDILFQKNTNVLCTSTVSIYGHGLISTPVQFVKLQNGPIVGFGRCSIDLLMCCHESGLLSLVYYKHGDLKYIEGSANSIKDGSSSKGDIYRYSGFGFSPNKGLAFVGKNLSCFYDHNLEKDPGKVIVFSTLSTDNTWEIVKQHFVTHDYRLEPIADVLMAFRYQLRTRKELDIDKFLDGTGGPLDIAPEFLKLYLWVLRAMHLYDKDQEIGVDESKVTQVEAVFQRQQQVEDELLQRHYIALLESIDESLLSKLNLEEARSLFLIQQFLNSKPNLRHLSFEPAIIPTEAPKCVICDSVVDFVETLSGQEEDPLGDAVPPSRTDGTIRPGKVAGFEWSNQQCEEKHTFPVCILSLLPCTFPYRTCEICRVVASLKPVFGMKPECPLCGSEMRASDAVDEEECENEDNSDLENFDDPPGVRFLGVKSEDKDEGSS